MKINVIEQSSLSKTGQASDNEDGIFLSDDFIAVIDGTTSKESKKQEGRTGGQIVRDAIMECLGSMDGSQSFFGGVLEIQRYIERTFPASRYFQASASAVIFSVKHRQIWLVGDCQAAVNGKRYTHGKTVDEILANARAMVLCAAIMDGMSEQDLADRDIGREMILPFLKLQQKFENTPGRFGYLVFNNAGMPEDVLRDKGVTVDVPERSEIILASDGYPQLMGTLAQSEEMLAKTVAADPLCYIGNVSTKGIRKGNISYDDRTYLRFRI